MNLDVRAPAGYMFLLLGVVLVGYGALSDPAQYGRSLGININLAWGAVMMAFGAAMLLWRRLAPHTPHLRQTSNGQTPTAKP